MAEDPTVQYLLRLYGDWLVCSAYPRMFDASFDGPDDEDSGTGNYSYGEDDEGDEDNGQLPNPNGEDYEELDARVLPPQGEGAERRGG
jgi:hypothetical protein